MKNNSRRDFFRLSAMASIGFMGLNQFACSPKSAQVATPSAGYGPLKPDPDKIFDLPEGFSYKIISRWKNPMSDGLLTPNKGDGMATFSGSAGKVILIRNHEISTNDLESGAFGSQNELLENLKKEQFFDYGNGTAPCLGGTTTVVFNEETQEVEKEFLSLVGTIRNCAGGMTPWKSWITCEESVERAGGTNEKNHGYNFEVPASEVMAMADPVPLVDMGRFNHEAICVDPRTSIVYQTEDRHDGLIYRFIPTFPGQLAKGGKLQALAILDQPGTDTRNWEGLPDPKISKNQFLAVRWIDLDNVEAPEDDLRLRGFEQGAAKFARGEGMWFGDNELFFACTNGGHIRQGQVWRYRPSEFEATPREDQSPGRLELFAEPNNTDICKHCDNLTISPWGDLILCEDNSDPFLVGLTPRGEFYKLGANVGHAESEITGATFSPSGQTLFFNIQHVGLTFAVTGPWKNNVV